MTDSPIRSVDSYAVRIPRDLLADRGTAGSPARLGEKRGSHYSIAETYATVYSDSIESALVKITTEDGIVGWGEAQSPVVPQAAQSIVAHLLAPLLIGQNTLSPVRLHERMYNAMRVRGHFGGFYADAIGAVDCALWDIAGKRFSQPVYSMLGGPVRDTIPAYISGLAGSTIDEKIEDAELYFEDGFRTFKVFHAESEEECLALVRRLRERFGGQAGILVDALWRLDEKGALRFAHKLAEYGVGWLEAPLPPEDLRGHQRLAAQSPVPIALGESYRTAYEVLPFLKAGAVHILQPDIGRTGITEGMRIGSLAQAFHVPIALHLSIALGPQIAAALHAAAALSNLSYVECNPRVLAISQRFSRLTGAEFGAGGFSLPASSGLSVSMDEDALRDVLLPTAAL